MPINTNEFREKLTDTVHAAADLAHTKLDDDYEEYSPRPQHVLKWMARKYFAPFRSVDAFGCALIDFFPIFKWLPAYSWRDNFLFDLISGITTGVMFVPQGIAYSYLAGVDPVYGLYSSFFAPLFYIFLGASPHVSRGPSSVLGIMSGVSNEQIRRSYAEDLAIRSAFNSTIPAVGAMDAHLAMPDAITVAATLTFTIGLIQLGMGLARLEFAADYFSEALVGGYTLAAAVHTLFSQMGVLLGISVKKGSSPGYLFKLIYELCTRLFEVNFVSFLASVCGIIFLFVGKEVVNPWINRNSKIKLSLPYELVLMIIATLISQCFNFSSNYQIKVVGEVPKGLPMPRIPRFDLLVYALPNAVAIAMVTLAMHFSMVKLFASRMHYSVDSSQELYAIGLGSVFSGCFPVYPTSTALGRTMVMVESGAKSQISSAISCVLVLTVILWFGPLFRSLPQCILSVVVVVALRPIFRKSSEIFHIWNLSKYDAVIWMVSFVGTVLTNVITGICIAIVFTLFTAIFRTQWPVWSVKFSRRSFSSKDALFSNHNAIKKNETIIDYCVFRFDSFLLFTNAERFQKYVEETLWRWKRQKTASDNGYVARKKQLNANELKSGNAKNSQNSHEDFDELRRRLFVFDFSTITQIDVAGLAALRKCVRKILLERHALRIAFVNCHESVRESLFKAEVVANMDDDFYAALDDALCAFQRSAHFADGGGDASADRTTAKEEEDDRRLPAPETLVIRESELRRKNGSQSDEADRGESV